MGRMRLFVCSARCKPSHPWESGAGKLLASPHLVPQCPSVHFFSVSFSEFLWLCQHCKVLGSGLLQVPQSPLVKTSLGKHLQQPVSSENRVPAAGS